VHWFTATDAFGKGELAPTEPRKLFALVETEPADVIEINFAELSEDQLYDIDVSSLTAVQISQCPNSFRGT